MELGDQLFLKWLLTVLVISSNRLSCMYCIVAAREATGPATKIVFSSVCSGGCDPIEAEILSDRFCNWSIFVSFTIVLHFDACRLFLYRSTDIAVERLCATHDYFILSHYVHGSKAVQPSKTWLWQRIVIGNKWCRPSTRSCPQKICFYLSIPVWSVLGLLVMCL